MIVVFKFRHTQVFSDKPGCVGEPLKFCQMKLSTCGWTATPETVFRCFGLKESCSWNWSQGLIEDSYHKHMMGIGWYTHYIYIIYIYIYIYKYDYNDLEPLYMVSTFAGWLFFVVVFDRPIFYIGNCHNLWTGNRYSPNFVFGDSWIYFLTLLISGWLVAESIWKLKVSFFFNRSKFLCQKTQQIPDPPTSGWS